MIKFRNILLLCFLPMFIGNLLAGEKSFSSPEKSADCSELLNVKFPKLQNDEPKSLCDYKGNVVLVVNTASFCGFTKQYKGLENLYSKYQNRGLVVLGFPSNDFGNQEPGSNKEIADFCENTYGVKFPMFAKSKVKGPNANKLFLDLAEMSEEPRWNFHKYLIDRDGNFVKSYSSFTSPKSRRLIKDIESLLKLRT